MSANWLKSKCVTPNRIPLLVILESTLKCSNEGGNTLIIPISSLLMHTGPTAFVVIPLFQRVLWRFHDHLTAKHLAKISFMRLSSFAFRSSVCLNTRSCRVGLIREEGPGYHGARPASKRRDSHV